MLSETIIKNLKTTGKPYRQADTPGTGLHVHVSAIGTKTYRVEYTFNKKQEVKTIGKTDLMKLKEARTIAHEYQVKINRGQNPDIKSGYNFEALALEFCNDYKKWPENHKQRGRLVSYVFPEIGNYDIEGVTAPIIKAILLPICKELQGDTPHRIASLISEIYDYAINSGITKINPAATVRKALPAPKKGHFEAIINPEKLPPLLKFIDGYHGNRVTRAYLRILPHIFIRPGELREMKWENIIFKTGKIEYFAKKTKVDMIVIMSDFVRQEFEELYKLTGSEEYCFSSFRRNGEPISDNTVRQALRRAGWDVDVHGFRATARTIIAEHLGYEERQHFIEMQLSHVVKDPNGNAYNRTAFIKQRGEMLAKWSDYLRNLADF